jgi:biotin carboxyl carrier protein
MEKIFIINGIETKVQNYSLKGDEVSFTLEGKGYRYSLIDRKGHELIIEREGRFHAAVGSPNREGDSIIVAGGREAIVAPAGKKSKRERSHGGGLTSPMPGKIFKIIKASGAQVEKGETILILEAMKMEHSIRADKDGVIKQINYKEGELVQGGVVLVELE